MTINKFRGKYSFLSNFFPVQIEDNLGLIYPSVEHAYQAMKSEDIKIRQCFQTGTSGDAKRNGRRISLRNDWEDEKVAIMLYLLRQKFSQEIFRKKLLETKDEELVEGNTWGDIFWGVCNGTGKNMLGQLLMQIREELKVLV
jgi:ribA/ribD-fused uncharacterized protein